MDALVVTQFITLLTLIVSIALQLYKEQRNRRWDKEDRAELARVVILQAKSANKARTRIARKTQAAIKANTEMSTRAFHEANSVNLKIEALGLEHNALDRRAQDREDREDKIDNG